MSMVGARRLLSTCVGSLRERLRSLCRFNSANTRQFQEVAGPQHDVHGEPKALRLRPSETAAASERI